MAERMSLGFVYLSFVLVYWKALYFLGLAVF